MLLEENTPVAAEDALSSAAAQFPASFAAAPAAPFAS